MTATYGHKWTSTHGDDFATGPGRLWAKELAGVGPKRLARALEVWVSGGNEWPPTLVELKSACFGIPAMPVVKLERAGPASEQSGFTILVGQMIDSTEWRMADFRFQQRLLIDAYEMAKAHVLAGGLLPEYVPPERQLQPPECHRPPPDHMLSPGDAMRQIERMLHVATPEPPPPRPPPDPKPCRRCNGTMKDPLPDAYHPDQLRPGECLACYGSGNEANINRIVNPDGTIKERAI